jgi:hypothetical protein
MTSYLEQQLTAGMHDEVGEAALSGDVLAAAMRGHQRRQVLRRTVYVAGVAGLAGVTAAALNLGSGPGAGPQPGGERPAVAAAGTPQLHLAAAIAAGQNISYKIKVTVPDGRGGVTTTEGAFDPATATGYLTSRWSGAAVVTQERLVDGFRYWNASGVRQWQRLPGTYDRLAYDRSNNGHNDTVAGSAGASADPQELLAELRGTGATITEPGAGVFHFEITLEPQTTPRTTLNQIIAGDITLGADKRIATIVYTRTTKWTKGTVSGTDRDKVTMTFSDYGTPVTVEKPANAVVATTATK